MLCFVETDAIVAAETAELLLGVCVKRSFDRITVDGQLSTNDTAILLCGGASGVAVEPESEGELLFGQALDALLRQLAIDMCRDGEGARRVGRVTVRGGHGPNVERVARAIANSPLVKTALYGGDPNWGRIVQAIGLALPDTAPLPYDIAIEGVQVCVAGNAVDHDEDDLTERAWRATRSSTPSACPATASRPRSSSPTSVTSTSTSTPSTPPRPGPPMRDVSTLLEALPYIREFHGRTVVIKYGGAAMEDPALREDFARDVVLLKYVGMNPVVVHGGGPEITAYMERLNLPVEFVGGLRVSSAETVEIAKMVLIGKVNKDIVLRINRHGQSAIGLCGDDGRLFLASVRRRPTARTWASSGASRASTSTCCDHIANDYIPVIASVGSDREGNSYNINADEAAGAVARALRPTRCSS